MVLGVITWFIFADEPATAHYLTPEERSLVQARLDSQPGQTESAKQFHWADVFDAFYDWKIWLFCFAQFGADVMLYGKSHNITKSKRMTFNLTYDTHDSIFHFPTHNYQRHRPWILHRHRSSLNHPLLHVGSSRLSHSGLHL